MEKILSKQEEYGIDLVNNADFQAFAGSVKFSYAWDEDKYEDSSLKIEDAYPFSQEVIDYWGHPSDPNLQVDPIKTVEDLKEAIWVLFWWRASHDLEKVSNNFGPDSDIYYAPVDNRIYECSPATSEIEDVLRGFSNAFMLNYKNAYYQNDEEQEYDYNESHLLQGIVDWMDEHYGNE